MKAQDLRELMKESLKKKQQKVAKKAFQKTRIPETYQILLGRLEKAAKLGLGSLYLSLQYGEHIKMLENDGFTVVNLGASPIVGRTSVKISW